ncbi:DNA-processing protein DprA [Deinococcus sp.]|uniref:DNA-processing protein DprA n=1 Tax=Deinococcus sp. TaxID=47478 RepID=UPI003B5C1CC3
MTSASLAARTLLTLHFVPGVGQRSLLKLSRHPQFLNTPLTEMGAWLPALRARLTPDALQAAGEQAQANLELARADGAAVVCVLDATYPPLLSETPDPPAFLFVKGHLRPEQCVAVIGTREPTPHGAEIARRATHYLAERGWSIISGLALGVDAHAHQAALDTGGHTVAVLAHGLQRVSPRQHAALAGRILEQGGALVSEYPYGTGVFPAQFVKRDRTQAGLSQGVVMVQSGLKGGSLHASRASIEYGRPLGVPWPTRQDHDAGADKVQANLCLLGEPRGAAQLLRCRESHLQRVMAIHSRDDYPRFEAALSPRPRAEPARLF